MYGSFRIDEDPNELEAAPFGFHPPLPGGDPEEFLFQMEDNPAGLGVPQVDHPEIIYFQSPRDKCILFGGCNNRQDPCSRVDGFSGMPAARDSANSSGYGGAADKGMTMVKITNLPQEITSKHKLYELFRTFGSMTHVDILRSGGIGFVNFIRREDAERAINQLNGWCGARLMLVKSGPEHGLQYGQKMIKPGDVLESGHCWIRHTTRRFWRKPIEDAPEQGLQYGQKMVKPGDAPESGRGWIRDTERYSEAVLAETDRRYTGGRARFDQPYIKIRARFVVSAETD